MSNIDSPSGSGKTILFQEFPPNMPIFLCTGYTDLRKSIAGLSKIIEEDYETDSRSRCLTIFCGRRADRYKSFLYDGDGYCLLAEYFSAKRLHWPRNGGHTDGEMWYITKEQFSSLMEGNQIKEDDINEELEIPEPIVNTEVRTLLRHITKHNLMPGGFYVCTGYTDMRKSVNYFVSVVEGYGLDPQTSKSCYLFCGKQSDRVKILFYDGDGFVIITKKLNTGKFQWPKEKDELWMLVYSQIISLFSGEFIGRERVIRILEKK